MFAAQVKREAGVNPARSRHRVSRADSHKPLEFFVNSGKGDDAWHISYAVSISRETCLPLYMGNRVTRN